MTCNMCKDVLIQTRRPKGRKISLKILPKVLDSEIPYFQKEIYLQIFWREENSGFVVFAKDHEV